MFIGLVISTTKIAEQIRKNMRAIYRNPVEPVVYSRSTVDLLEYCCRTTGVLL